MRKGWSQYGLLIMAGALCQAAFAAPEVVPGVIGNYYGFQVGTTSLDAQTETLPNWNGDLVPVAPSKKGVGTRLFWGYQFTNYLALEGGYTYYSPATYKIPQGNEPQLRIQSLDMVGKGILPIFHGFSAFAKAGAAIVPFRQAGLLAPNPQAAHDGNHGITARPLFGGGLSYAFTPNFTVDVSATRITAGGVIPASSFVAVGVSYHAVDLYCGQFLC